ncbi:MAG: ribonuclease P protein component [Prevotella sp.]|nr:ribonuclease P protein component [Prevotella sp.]
MPSKGALTLGREERIKGQKLTDLLFNSPDSRALTTFPIRLIYLKTDTIECNKILVSVPKRFFKHAVDRNRIKRQVREAYRHNKHILADHNDIAMAFIWTGNMKNESQRVEAKVKKLLQQLAEKV